MPTSVRPMAGTMYDVHGRWCRGSRIVAARASAAKSSLQTKPGKSPKALPRPQSARPCRPSPVDLGDGHVHVHARLAPQLVEADGLGRDDVAVLVEVERAHDPVVDMDLEQL